MNIDNGTLIDYIHTVFSWTHFENLRDIKLKKTLNWKISNLMLYEIRDLCRIKSVRFDQIMSWLDFQFDSVCVSIFLRFELVIKSKLWSIQVMLFFFKRETYQKIIWNVFIFVNIIISCLQIGLKRHDRRYRSRVKWRRNFWPQTQLTINQKRGENLTCVKW